MGKRIHKTKNQMQSTFGPKNLETLEWVGIGT